MTDARIIAYVVGQLQGLVGSARPMTARKMKQQLRDLLDWIEAASTRGTVEAVLAEARGATSDDELDRPAEEWLVEAFRQGYLVVQGDEQPKCQEWARVCMMNEVPCIIVREGGQFGPWVSLDGPLVGGPDSTMWQRAVDLFRARCVKTAGGDAVVAASLSGALESVDEAERLAKALVGLIVARRQSGEGTSNGAGEP